MSRMDIQDSACVLCNIEVKYASHLFLRCLEAKAIWFAACWGVKSEKLDSSNDIIKFILDLPPDPCQAQDRWLVSLNMVLTLEEIWHTRNVVLHLKGSVDLQSSIGSISARLKECSLVFCHPEVHMFA